LLALLLRTIIGALRRAGLCNRENFEAGCNSTKNNFAESKTKHRGFHWFPLVSGNLDVSAQCARV